MNSDTHHLINLQKNQVEFFERQRIFILLSELFGVKSFAQDCEVLGITCDSRMIKPGYIFVCLKGEKDTGYRYIKEAEKNGACAIIADSKIDSDIFIYLCHNPRKKMAEFARRIYENPDEKISVIGVTGTNGRTTVTHLVKEIFINGGKNIATIGTNGCYYNEICTDQVFTTSTTPEACELYKILYDMKKLGADNAVMEVSSHALALDRVLGIKFKVSAFTNLTMDHLDFHKDMEEYFCSKRTLFEKAEKCAINTDDKYGKRLFDEFYNKSVSYGLKDADIIAENIEYTPKGTYFTINDKGRRTDVFLGICGKFSVYNALCSYAIAKSFDIDDEVIKNTFKITQGIKGRAEILKTNTDFSVMIDYAHSPDGLKNIIESAREYIKGKIIVVFGCGGNRDKGKRAIMGEIAGTLADFTVITSDNPRFENPMDIVRDIESGISGVTKEYTVVCDRYEAIKTALLIAKSGDCVILCGKGHEDYIIIGNEKIHFDEREAVFEILDIKRQK